MIKEYFNVFLLQVVKRINIKYLISFLVKLSNKNLQVVLLNII